MPRVSGWDTPAAVSGAVPALPSEARDRGFYVFTAVVSVVALGVIAWILVFRQAAPGGADLSFMPAVNAGLNATASVLLASGWLAVRRQALRVHKFLMVSAFACSALFLVGYLAYHWVHGDTRFQGTGAIRVVYLSILATHVILSMTVVPGALLAFWFAFRRQWTRHRRLNRVVLPIWLYVSVTGVAIFFFLRADAAASGTGHALRRQAQTAAASEPAANPASTAASSAEGAAPASEARTASTP